MVKVNQVLPDKTTQWREVNPDFVEDVMPDYEHLGNLILHMENGALIHIAETKEQWDDLIAKA
jgi:hypothetical protein